MYYLETTQNTDHLCHLYFTLCVLCLGPEAVQQSTKETIRQISSQTYGPFPLSRILLCPSHPQAITEEMKVTDGEYGEMVWIDGWLD